MKLLTFVTVVKQLAALLAKYILVKLTVAECCLVWVYMVYIVAEP